MQAVHLLACNGCMTSWFVVGKACVFSQACCSPAIIILVFLHIFTTLCPPHTHQDITQNDYLYSSIQGCPAIFTPQHVQI